MADFLTRLAARTLGTAPTARPILAPLFALPDDIPWTETPTTPPVERVLGSEPLPAGTPARSRPMEQAPLTRTVTEQAGHEPASETDPSISLRKPAHPGRRDQAPAPEKSIEVTSARLSQQDHTTTTEMPTARRAQPKLTEVEITQTRHEPESGAVRVDQQTIVEPAGARVQARGRTDVPSPPPLEDFPEFRTAPARHRTSQDPNELPAPPHSFKVQAPRRGQPSTDEAEVREQTPPVIRVSIGRIEVRAVSAPSPPAQSTPPPPRLSLDEYLRGLNGGRR